MEKRRQARPGLDTLEGRALLSVAILESEPNNTPARADILALDPSDGLAVVTGSLRGQDRDFYSFQANRTAILGLRGQATGKPTRVDVFEAGSGRRLWTGRIGPECGAALVVHAGESLLIQVRGRAGNGPASPRSHYGLHLAMPTPPPPAVPTPTGGSPTTAPSETSPTAVTIVLDDEGRAVVTGTLSPGDVDVFSFTATRTGYVSLATDGRTPILIDARDTTGRPLLTVFGDRPNFVSRFSVAGGTTYSLRISQASSAPAGAVAYRVDLVLDAGR